MPCIRSSSGNTTLSDVMSDGEDVAEEEVEQGIITMEVETTENPPTTKGNQ